MPKLEALEGSLRNILAEVRRTKAKSCGRVYLDERIYSAKYGMCHSNEYRLSCAKNFVDSFSENIQ